MKDKHQQNGVSIRDDEIYTIKEAADFLQCAPSTIYRAVRGTNGFRLPAFRIGRAGGWRLSRAMLEEWIRSQMPDAR